MSDTYTTISGDMWDLIAFKELSSEIYIDELIKLNIKHCDVVVFAAGVVLKLPEPIEDVPEGLPVWRNAENGE